MVHILTALILYCVAELTKITVIKNGYCQHHHHSDKRCSLLDIGGRMNVRGTAPVMLKGGLYLEFW